MASTTALPDSPYAPLRLPAFRRYLLGLLALTFATQLQGVVVGWQIYALTKDPLALGLIGLAEALPFIGFALYAGHVADRVDRRRLMLVATVVLVACSLALLALAWRPVAAGPAGRRVVHLIYAVIVASGVARSFLQPARTAFSVELVPRALLPSSVTWRSAVWQTASVIGPALGGLLYAFGGARTAYAVDVTLLGVALVAFVSIRHRSPARERVEGSVARSLTEGVRYVRGQPVILGAMTLDLFSVLFGGATALLPIFADDILRVGPEGLGVLRAAPAAGAVLVSFWLAHRPPFARAGRVLFAAVAAFGALMIVFGLSRSYPLSVAVLALSGAVDMVSVNIRSLLLQLLVPEHLLGRVSSVNQIFIGSSNEIGAFESGVAARLIGAATSVVVGGALTLAVVAGTAWRVPALRRLRGIG
jgi:MFS family permease